MEIIVTGRDCGFPEWLLKKDTMPYAKLFSRLHLNQAPQAYLTIFRKTDSQSKASLPHKEASSHLCFKISFVKENHFINFIVKTKTLKRNEESPHQKFKGHFKDKLWSHSKTKGY